LEQKMQDQDASTAMVEADEWIRVAEDSPLLQNTVDDVDDGTSVYHCWEDFVLRMISMLDFQSIIS